MNDYIFCNNFYILSMLKIIKKHWLKFEEWVKVYPALFNILLVFSRTIMFLLSVQCRNMKSWKLYILINGINKNENRTNIVEIIDIYKVNNNYYDNTGWLDILFIPEVIRSNLVCFISVLVIIYMLRGKVKFVNLIQLEYILLIVVIITIYKRLGIYIFIIILSGVSRIIFILLYIKRTS